MLIKKYLIFFIFLFLTLSTYFAIDHLKEKKISETENLIFNDHMDYMVNSFDSYFNKIQTDSIEHSKNIIENLDIVNYLLKPNKSFNYFNSEDIYLKIYDPTGKMIFSNENMINGKEERKFHIKHFLKDPIFNYSFLTTKKGLTLTNLFPVYDKELIGVVQLDYQFEKLVKQMDKKHIKTLILLNSSLSSVIDINISYSRNFIDKRYVVNKNSDKYYQKILEQSDFINSDKTHNINKKDGILMTKIPLVTNNKTVIGDIYLTKSIENIDLTLTSFIRTFFDIINILLTLIYALILYFIYNANKSKIFALENERLLKENMKLSILSDQLDYNEKKLSNLFNLQPNIMFISNGVDIVQVNKRFMGFFRRYKTFDNFKQKHKDISELFEPFDKPNYIWDELIEDKYWLEYILENPKRLYKTIMSVDNEQHHFIIKVNEMDYVRNFQERYIVVAFVDITQDVVQKDDTKSEISNTDPLDISYLLENTITSTVKEFINIIPTKQAIFKGDEKELYDLGSILVDLNLTNKKEQLNWQFFLPITTISFIINQLTSNYDETKTHDIDEESIKMASSIINSLSSHLSYELKQIEHEDLSNILFNIIKEEELTLHNYHKLDNLYKFIMYVEEQELSIYINFDDKSMKYLKQIYMLGMIFDS